MSSPDPEKVQQLVQQCKELERKVEHWLPEVAKASLMVKKTQRDLFSGHLNEIGTLLHELGPDSVNLIPNFTYLDTLGEYMTPTYDTIKWDGLYSALHPPNTPNHDQDDAADDDEANHHVDLPEQKKSRQTIQKNDKQDVEVEEQRNQAQRTEQKAQRPKRKRLPETDDEQTAVSPDGEVEEYNVEEEEQALDDVEQSPVDGPSEEEDEEDEGESEVEAVAPRRPARQIQAVDPVPKVAPKGKGKEKEVIKPSKKGSAEEKKEERPVATEEIIIGDDKWLRFKVCAQCLAPGNTLEKADCVTRCGNRPTKITCEACVGGRRKCKRTNIDSPWPPVFSEAIEKIIKDLKEKEKEKDDRAGKAEKKGGGKKTPAKRPIKKTKVENKDNDDIEMQAVAQTTIDVEPVAGPSGTSKKGKRSTTNAQAVAGPSGTSKQSARSTKHAPPVTISIPSSSDVDSTAATPPTTGLFLHNPNESNECPAEFQFQLNRLGSSIHEFGTLQTTGRERHEQAFTEIERALTVLEQSMQRLRHSVNLNIEPTYLWISNVHQQGSFRIPVVFPHDNPGSICARPLSCSIMPNPDPNLPKLLLVRCREFQSLVEDFLEDAVGATDVVKKMKRDLFTARLDNIKEIMALIGPTAKDMVPNLDYLDTVDDYMNSEKINWGSLSSDLHPTDYPIADERQAEIPEDDNDKKAKESLETKQSGWTKRKRGTDADNDSTDDEVEEPEEELEESDGAAAHSSRGGASEGEDEEDTEDEEDSDTESTPPPRPARRVVAVDPLPKVAGKGKGKAKEVVKASKKVQSEETKEDRPVATEEVVLGEDTWLRFKLCSQCHVSSKLKAKDCVTRWVSRPTKITCEACVKGKKSCTRTNIDTPWPPSFGVIITEIIRSLKKKEKKDKVEKRGKKTPGKRPQKKVKVDNEGQDPDPIAGPSGTSKTSSRSTKRRSPSISISIPSGGGLGTPPPGTVSPTSPLSSGITVAEFQLHLNKLGASIQDLATLQAAGIDRHAQALIGVEDTLTGLESSVAHLPIPHRPSE
ncbi:hypothetical protein BDN72DRAFT_865298 [Pluteus cervinus]|uniref:Uncharacterized protein n=1 Tax=Pluteus cervinus TaxID=181527 RepID=A0ACD3A0E0_9AGAR|nr:hypothetical protein BDN72DRAFT_865298 [Pluteus cervinus]